MECVHRDRTDSAVVFDDEHVDRGETPTLDGDKDTASRGRLADGV